MKTPTFGLILFGVFSVVSCKRENLPNPKACFNTNQRLYKPGEVVFFENCSNDFDQVEWDFGNGITSSELHPTYKWNEKGPHLVSLKVSKKDKMDIVRKNISVADSTYAGFVVNFSNWLPTYQDSAFYFEMYALQGVNFTESMLFYQGKHEGPGFVKSLESPLKVNDPFSAFKIKFLLRAKNGIKDSATTVALDITDVTLNFKEHATLYFANVEYGIAVIYK